MTTTKTNHNKTLINLRADYMVVTREREDAREAWLANRKVVAAEVADLLYKEYHSYDKQIEKLEEEIKFHSIMLQDKKYATRWLYTDAHAYEIIEEKTDKMILVRQLKATIKEDAREALHNSFVPGGFCGHYDNDLQEWDFETNESNPIETIRKHKNGRWYDASGCLFTITAEPYERFDYNF